MTRTLLPNGGVLVEDSEQNGIEFEVPWAYDARGVSVPAKYSIVDGALVLKVEPTADTAYPVIADPWGTIVGWVTKTVKVAAKYVSKLATPIKVAWDTATRKISRTWPKYVAGWAAGTLTILVCYTGGTAVAIAVFGLAAAAAVGPVTKVCTMLGIAATVAIAEVVDTSD